jgi:hypothetical protein
VSSGKDFNVSSDRGLVGYCDFLLSRSPESISIQAPVCAIVEAKKKDINSGIAQVDYYVSQVDKILGILLNAVQE